MMCLLVLTLVAFAAAISPTTLPHIFVKGFHRVAVNKPYSFSFIVATQSSLPSTDTFKISLEKYVVGKLEGNRFTVTRPLSD